MSELRYTPGLGDGVLIAGESSFVAVRGSVDPDHVDRIWAALLEGRSLAGLLDVVTRGRLDDLQDFVVAVPDVGSGGLRIIQRPGLDIVTTDSDGVVQVHSAAGTAVWSEHATQAGSSVVVDLAVTTGSSESFPLRSGAVAATRVNWIPDEALRAVVDSPTSPPMAAAGSTNGLATHDIDRGDLAEEASPRSGVADGRTVNGGYTIASDDLIEDDSAGGELESEVSWRLVDAPEPEADPYDSLFGATMYRSVESAAVRPESEQSRGADPVAESEPAAAPRHAVSSPFAGAAPGRPMAPTEMIDCVPVTGGLPDAVQGPSGDHDGYTVTAASLREMGQTSTQASVPAHTALATPMVHAIACGSGHPNPPQSGTCRVCGSPLPFQDPITVPRPALGLLIFAGGREVVLDRLVLIGRSPAVERVSPGDLPHLVKLDSPTKDLSRNHVEVRLEGWHVLVVDLQSTNGTVVQLPGRPAERVHPLEPYAIVPGTVITIGDEQSFVYEVRG